MPSFLFDLRVINEKLGIALKYCKFLGASFMYLKLGCSNTVLLSCLFFAIFSTSLYAKPITISKFPTLPIVSEPADESRLAQAKMDVAIAETKLNSLELELKEAEQAIVHIKGNIKELEAKLQNAKLASSELANGNTIVEELSASLAYQQSLLELEQARGHVLRKAVDLANQNFAKLQERKLQLEYTYQVQHQQKQRKSLEQFAEQLQQEQKKWLGKLTEYNQQLQLLANGSGPNVEKRKQLLELRVFEAEEASSINHINLILAQLENQYNGLAKASMVTQSIAALNATNIQVDDALRQVHGVMVLIKTKIETLQKRLAIELQNASLTQITKQNGYDIRSMSKEFIDTYQAQLNSFSALQKQFLAYQKTVRLDLAKALAKRQELPGLDWQAWQLFLTKLWTLPELIWQSAQAVWQQFAKSIESYAWPQWTIWICYEVILIGLWRLGRHYLKKLYLAYYRAEEPLTKNTLFLVLKLLRRNLSGLVLAFNVFSLLAINSIPFKRYALFFSFAVVWFGYRFALGLARLMLLETVRDAGGKDVRLYHKLKWFFAMGAILMGLLIAARQLPVDYSVNDFINRLFMLQLLLVSGITLRNWAVVPALINSYFENRQVYFARAIRWLSLLIPFALLVNAIIGLVGYVELAWTMCAYQGLFILVLLAYLFIRNLLVDLMQWVANRFILKLPNGWLLSEAFLKPLDKLLRLAFLLLAGAFLLYIYGWDQNTYIVSVVKTVFNYPIEIFNNQITLITVLKAIFVILLLAWVARWSREFSYRWLYAHHKDVGVRNSLSVFTQYLVVIISVYTALHLSKLDFTALNYILGGVSLGAGLGLRDLVNNFASGILLLIERPVKKGDIVTISTYEGEVTHIGMRAMTIRTWDHMEVLVPNSEAFSKSFTNWTHEDMVIRTVVSIKIQRVDNPQQVKEIILYALTTVSDVLADPPSQIYMKVLNEPLIEFEVRYFINIQVSGSRSRVRSDVLYAIWEQFKQHGINPPIPPQDVQVHLVKSDRK